MKTILLSALSLIFTAISSHADAPDLFYDQGSNFTRYYSNATAIGVAQHGSSVGYEANGVIVDLIDDPLTSSTWRIVTVDFTNDEVNEFRYKNYNGFGYRVELEASPLGRNAVFISDLETLFTSDSGATWNFINLPTSSTHTDTFTIGYLLNINVAKFDDSGLLHIIYISSDPNCVSTDCLQVNYAVFDQTGQTVNHQVVVTQDLDWSESMSIDTAMTHYGFVALVKPGSDWKDSNGTIYHNMAEVLKIDSGTFTITERSSIGAFPSDPNVATYNTGMFQHDGMFSEHLVTDGHKVITMTKRPDATDTFGPIINEDINVYSHDPIYGFFPDHGTPVGTDPLVDLTQLTSFQTANIKARTMSGTFSGLIQHMAAKWFALGDTPDNSFDLAYYTPDDIEGVVFGGERFEAKRVRIFDPLGVPSMQIEEINDLDCGVLGGKKRPLGCDIYWYGQYGTMVGTEGDVASAFTQYIRLQNGTTAVLFVIDIS